VFIFNERHLEKALAEYVGYFNHWRPHRSIGQRAPCGPRTRASHRSDQAGKIIAIPVARRPSARLSAGRMIFRIDFLRPTTG
jgi:hypothetical protein